MTANLRLKQQNGNLILMVGVFLLIIAAGSVQYFARETENIRVSGGMRDSTESLMMAESAMELVRGRFISTMDTVTENPTDVLDNFAAASLAPNKATPNASLFTYMYYVSAGAGLDQNVPSILQKVADGEAIAQTTSAMTTRHIASNTSKVRVDDLFSTVSTEALAPFLYTVDSNGLLIASNATKWGTETASVKAAVWIEVLENTTDSTAVDLFVQSIAQVGNGKSYVQRYIGSYNNILGSVSILAEASNINRGGP